jgi:hypothetical protein
MTILSFFTRVRKKLMRIIIPILTAKIILLIINDQILFLKHYLSN